MREGGALLPPAQGSLAEASSSMPTGGDMGGMAWPLVQDWVGFGRGGVRGDTGLLGVVGWEGEDTVGLVPGEEGGQEIAWVGDVGEGQVAGQGAAKGERQETGELGAEGEGQLNSRGGAEGEGESKG